MIPYFQALFIQRHGMISALMIYGHLNQYIGHLFFSLLQMFIGKHSGSMEECTTQDRRVAGSSLTEGTVLCP